VRLSADTGRDSFGPMRLCLLAVTLWIACFPATGAALDDTVPRLRWGVLGGVSGSLPFGDLRASGAGRDEFTPALWVDLEPLQFDLGAHFNVAPVARFVVRGGVDGKAIEEALDERRRRDANGKKLPLPEVSALELGLKLRYFPWGDGTVRPYAGVQLTYSTLGASYGSVGVPATGPGTPALELHRHRGLGTKLLLGVRWDLPIRVFNTDMLAPVAFELSYTHNTWLDLDRDAAIETNKSKLVGARPFVDYLGASLLVGFLR